MPSTACKLESVYIKHYIATIAVLLSSLNLLYAQGDRRSNLTTNDTFHFNGRFVDYDFPVYSSLPKGDTMRARRSIQHPYTGYNFKVTLGYIEKDTVTRQELVDNAMLGLRVLPAERGCVVDSFTLSMMPSGGDFIGGVRVHGDHLPAKNVTFSYSWWYGHGTLYIEKIEGHKLSDGRKMYFPPLRLVVKN